MERRKHVEACSLALGRQLEGPERATVRRGEHPRASVRRLDLLSDAELDEFRARFRSEGESALDAAVELETELEAALAALGLGAGALAKLPRRPILATFACLACGVTAPARTERAWPVDRAMRATGLPERDVLQIQALLRDVFDAEEPEVDAFSRDVVIELAAVVGQADYESLRAHLVESLRSASTASDV